ncbi:MAG TPA: alpha/beta hydrolase, partial [Candidatus Saccharimonadales bacterium]|nr:alpha/beta hydrolase [Candidatus Saccharimonadales bacterium]
MNTNTPNQPVGLLLLSGAGIGSWAWQEVTQSLKFPAVAVDYPKENAQAGMDEYVAAALKQAETLQTQKIVVVGHSLSGAIGLKVAEELGERLAGFVAVAAAIPKNGGSFVSSLPFPQ